MGILDNLFRRDDSSATAQETPTQTPKTEPEVNDVLLNALLRGDPITREQAMTIPAVSAAVNFISGQIASMPVKLYWIKTDEAGNRYVESRDDDPRVKMLNNDTGDTLDAYQLKKAMVEDYLMGHGGYAYIQKSERSNDVGGLYYVRDDYVTVLWNADPIFKKRSLFVYDNEYQLFDFIKLLRNSKDGAQGTGVTEEVGKALEAAYATLTYQLMAAKNGGNKKGFLKATKRLGQDEINVLKAAWRNLYANTGESVVVLNNGLEFQEASNSATEMQLDQNKKTLTDEINAIFGIYPSDFYRTFKEAIYPIVKAFETALNHDLLLESEKGKKFFEFDVKEILRVSIKERYEAYKIAKETGFLTLNEIRRAENLSRVEGLDVINVGLSAVLYDTNKHTYYTPNTDAVHDMDNIEKEIVDHDVISEQEQEGNIASLRYNPNHDGKTGKFTTGHGGGGGGGSSSDGSAGADGESGTGSSSADGEKSAKKTDKEIEENNRKQSDDWYHNKLTNDEKSQIINMQYNTKNLNKYLYDKKYAESLSPEAQKMYKKQAELAESALSKFELKDPIKTYRGVSGEEATKIIFGEKTTENFKSTSYDEKRAKAFAENQGGWIVEYHISPGKHGADVNGVPGASEREFLINKNVGYKSTKVEMADKKIVVEI